MNYDTLNSRTLNDGDATQAVSDPFATLVSGQEVDRTILLRTSVLNGTAPVAVDLSSNGYASHPTDTPYQQFEERLENPYNFSASLNIPDLCGLAQMGVGNSSLVNTDGGLDTVARYDWLGAEQSLYLGPLEPAALTTFTRISKGYSAGLSWDLDRINVLSRDFRFKLKRPLHARRYKGFGACLRGNGSTTYGVPATAITCPAGSVTFDCQLRPLTLVSGLEYIMAYQNSGLAGSRLLRLENSPANRLGFYVINDANVLYGITADGYMPVSGYLKNVCAVLDVPNLKIRLLVDGEEVATPVTIAGTFNTVLNTLNVLRRPDTGTNYLDIDIDEVKIWPYARTQTQIRESLSHEELGTEGQTAYWKMNEGSGTSAANSVSGGPALTLTSPTWVGSIEGDASISGTVKPIALGVRRQIEPKWVDPQRLVAQIHDGSMQAVTAVRDSGDAITFGADVSDIYGSAPTAGTYNTCLARGLIRFGSTPVGTITCDIQGDNGGLIGYANSTAEIDRKLKVDYAGLNNSLDIDNVAYNTLETLNSALVGEYFDEAIDIDEASNQVLSKARAWGGSTRVGLQTVGRIDDPTSKVATVTWDSNNIQQNSQAYRRDPFGIRYREVIVGYRPYKRTLSPDQVAGVVPLATRNDFGKDYRYVSKEIPGASEDAAVLTVLTSFDVEADARVEMDRLAAFLGRDLEIVNLEMVSGLFSHYIGTIVSLIVDQVQQDGTTIYRYATNGRNYIVVGINEIIAALQPDRFSVMLLG